MSFRRFFSIFLSVVATVLIGQQALSQGLFPDLFSSENDLTTDKLRAFVREESICLEDEKSLTFNQCVGRTFQRTVINILINSTPKGSGNPRENFTPIPSGARDIATSGSVTTVVPDAILSFLDINTGKVYTPGGYAEVKAVKGTIGINSYRRQALGLIDIATKSEIVPLGGVPGLVFITTTNTKIGDSIILAAEASKVAVYHVTASRERNKICFKNASGLNPPLASANVTDFISNIPEYRCSSLIYPYKELPDDPDPAQVEDSVPNDYVQEA